MHFSGVLVIGMNRKNSDISAIILAKNEEKRIGRCLESVEWVTERIVIDNGSTDQTALIAKQKSATVIRADATNNFAKLRNIGRDSAHEDWLLYVDADEEVTPRLKEEILRVVKDYRPGRSPVAYFLLRKNFYLGHPWPYRDKMERLFWKQGLVGWEGRLHESPRVTGAVGELRNPLVHNTHRTLEEMVEKTNEWSEIEADLRFRAGHPPIVWWRLFRVMMSSFWDSFIKQGGWRAGVTGWIESIFQAYSAFITYAKLWEMQQEDKKTGRQ